MMLKSVNYISKSILRTNRVSSLFVSIGTTCRSHVNVFKSPVKHRLPLAFATVFAGIPLIAKSSSQLEVISKKADQLFELGKYQELLSYLGQQESWHDQCELLWRVGRCKYHLSKQETDGKKKAEWLNDSLADVERALQIDADCGPAHKWAAILIDSVSSLQGTRSRIEKTLIVKKHMEEAIRLMPNDATSYYVLGEWHYTVSTIGWAQKKIASVVFATFPESSLEEALKLFEKAEQVEPGFYSKNLVLLAKTLNALGRDKERAQDSLLKVVRDYSTSPKWDDVEAVTEARTLLAKMGVRV